MSTVAVPVDDDGTGSPGYRITGRKQWISNGSIADAYTILAMAPGGPTWFIVERGAEGLSSAPPEDKHGIRLSNTAALFLDDVTVPASHVVGGVEGRGLVQAQQVFGYTRLMVAAFGLGGGWEAMDRAIRYSTERVQAGAPLSEKQGYTHKLIVPHVVRLEAARAVVEETATRIGAGEGAGGALNTEGAIAKYLATEAGAAAADAAIQAHGGYGYTRPYLVEKIRRDVRITTIYEGTSEIMEMTIARDRWQHHLKTRGDHYLAAGREMAALHATHPDVGADVSALALECLAGVLEACRVGRLTRNQHVLLRLGELIARAEASAVLVRRAAAAADGRLPEKSDRRFDASTLAAISRVYARDAALTVAEEGMRWVSGAAEPGTTVALTDELPLGRVRAAQAGLLADMNIVADALYDRVTPHGSED
jgi:alkylation response protein AidB-like acyl-CoA dehydrogenase